MKKLYFFIITSAFISTISVAQSFVLTPTDTYEASIALNSYTNHQVFMVNQTGSELILGWETINQDMPESWEITLCDFGGCHIGIPDSGTMYPIFDTINAYMRLTINPYDISATGTATFKVFDTKHPEQYEIVTFTIHSGNVTGLETVTSKTHFSVFPNPASEGIYVSNLGIEKGIISIVNMNGVLVRQSKISKDEKVFNIRDLQKGLYVVIISDSSGILKQKKLMIR